jgi:hypothetical protein
VSETADQTESDWASQIIDSLENVIGAVRSRTTDPVRNVVRMVVFAVSVIGLALSAFFLLTIGIVRLADRYLPTGIWLPYLLIGGIFTGVGLLVWSRRHNAA